ncbi:pyridoxal-binding domain pyridoxal-dependent decarboxylase [Medicago truncatula]|uniref:Arginine decarboxylase n=1 Tax=Medicago truncatula TaxID=3880 RepID=G7IFC2_MEDTR|nr:pyridoxal-binding domain pyridoxal-dependent decarboxylase [Medicago truncatula]
MIDTWLKYAFSPCKYREYIKEKGGKSETPKLRPLFSSLLNGFVVPSKCNQDKFFVEDIVEFGWQFRLGLEAGSKPELLLALSCLCKGNREAFLVCNGFKDNLVGRKLALNGVIALEQEEELNMVVEISNKLYIRLELLADGVGEAAQIYLLLMG